jgi:hypothetical protein
MGLVRRVREMGGEVIADRSLYGGDPARIIGPLLSQSGRVGSLWKIDEIVELSPERRAAAFVQLISEK